MSGFVSGGSSFGGSILSRVSADGFVWSVRVANGKKIAVPASLCIPFGSLSSARLWAGQVVTRLGWSVSVRRGKRCMGSAFEVKLLFPYVGLSCRSALASLPVVP
jgi:hypothetical protein